MQRCKLNGIHHHYFAIRRSYDQLITPWPQSKIAQALGGNALQDFARGRRQHRDAASIAIDEQPSDTSPPPKHNS